MHINSELEDRIARLAEKYHASGQELLAYLDGLLYADYNTYWDYVHLDTLLSLQNPKTNFPDEEIFIMYHQITELYFKLTLHELKQLEEAEVLDVDTMKQKLGRMNRYFGALTHSFGVMEKGMDRDQFLKFRMSLIPASGFQSAQYRKIEIRSTNMIQLVNKDYRDELRNATVKEMYDKIYWKWGATMADSGEKTLTLRQFERKYSKGLVELAEHCKSKNLLQLFQSLPESDQKDNELRELMRSFDVNVNINWPLQHYRTSVVYLAMRPADIMSTGGTNWQKYLPPRFQKRIFFPILWSDEELNDWGKKWVTDILDDVATKKENS